MAELLRPFAFRGKTRLLHKLCPKEGIRLSKVFGYQTSLDLHDYIQRCIYLHIFEPYESSLVKNYLRPNMTIIDVGANVGWYSLMAASIVGEQGHVFAFEPSPYVADLLRKTIQANNIRNISLFDFALSDAEGSATIYLSSKTDNHTPSMIRSDEENQDAPIQIRTRTLDSFLNEKSVRQIDLLKLDVEGFEPNVIKGGQEAFSKGMVKAVLCEFNNVWLERNGTTSKELYDLITSFGFRPHVPLSSASLQNIFFTSSS